MLKVLFVFWRCVTCWHVITTGTGLCITSRRWFFSYFCRVTLDRWCFCMLIVSVIHRENTRQLWKSLMSRWGGVIMCLALWRVISVDVLLCGILSVWRCKKSEMHKDTVWLVWCGETPASCTEPWLRINLESLLPAKSHRVVSAVTFTWTVRIRLISDSWLSRNKNPSCKQFDRNEMPDLIGISIGYKRVQ